MRFLNHKTSDVNPPGENPAPPFRRHTPEPEGRPKGLSEATTAPAAGRSAAHSSPVASGTADTGLAVFSAGQSRVKIGFVSASAGAGATTLAFAAAEYLVALAKKRRNGFFKSTVTRIALLELDPGAGAPAGCAYDKAGIDRRFAGRTFLSFYRLAAEGKPLADAANLDGGICFALRIPGESIPPPEPAVLHRLLNNLSAEVTLCDIPAHRFLSPCGATGLDRYAGVGTAAGGGESLAGSGGASKGREALRRLLGDLSHIICVIDPLPSRLLASAAALETVRAAETVGISVTYLFNKLNDGVNLREAARFIGVRNHISIPAISADAVYAAEFACRSLWSEQDVKNALAVIFRA